MDKNYIEGYKVFTSDFKAMGNIKFSVGMHKHIEGKIKAGPVDGNGFHLCINFEDTFRYADENPILCEVIGYGTISDEYVDNYNEYDGIYACSDLYVKRVVPREEIIEMAKTLPQYKLERLITTYNMTDEEIEKIEKTNKIKRIKQYIDYYHRNNKNAFKEWKHG